MRLHRLNRDDQHLHVKLLIGPKVCHQVSLLFTTSVKCFVMRTMIEKLPMWSSPSLVTILTTSAPAPPPYQEKPGTCSSSNTAGTKLCQNFLSVIRKALVSLSSSSAGLASVFSCSFCHHPSLKKFISFPKLVHIQTLVSIVYNLTGDWGEFVSENNKKDNLIDFSLIRFAFI